MHPDGRCDNRRVGFDNEPCGRECDWLYGNEFGRRRIYGRARPGSSLRHHRSQGLNRKGQRRRHRNSDFRLLSLASDSRRRFSLFQMRYILIPVKDLTRAKQRLSSLMSQEQRTRLACAMLENTFAAAARARNVDRIAVVTLYSPAIALAEKYGMELILESEQISES